MEREKLIEKVTVEILRRLEKESQAPSTTVGVSNRHIHLSQGDLEALFGKGYRLSKWKDLKQPGQFAAKETVTIVGTKGELNKVRILGPIRQKTQVEISKTDAYTLGIRAFIRESGDIENTPGIVIKGPNNIIGINEGVIIAKRHIHMPPAFAKQHSFRDKQMVSVRFEGERALEFDNVVIRVSDQFVNEMHIDTDEANAGNIKNGDVGRIVKD
ncbi:phosphate propanoyltransferase [Oceanobacillus halophilus]|uniref:Phosphate propanoyltransferase n=1 Tax=Oceanobacillus halophilus TaxID=930130 RepID=A0A494ZTH1_9BACI|nr:phosphate propanoyltransferase [Oceanobacillus halophilus]RKQ29251.1 phosphate propanoyltransferase [Oceanobacillus halophilus]